MYNNCVQMWINFVYIFSEMTSAKDNPDLDEKLKDVFVTASGTSFYKQCVPDDTLSLVYSSTALQYLSVRLVFVSIY